MSIKPTTYPTGLVERVEQEWKHYDEYYASGTLARPFFYHDVRKERVFLKSLVARFDMHPGSMLVDIGCGNGLYSNLFTDLGLQVTAVDRSQTAIDYCAQTYGSKCTWTCGDAFQLPSRATYDYAFCHFFTYFDAFDLPRDGVNASSNLMALLKPGGKLFFLWHTDLSATRLPPDRFSVMNFTVGQLKEFFPNCSLEVYAVDSEARICQWLRRYSFERHVSRLVCAWVQWHSSSWKRARLILVASALT